MLYSTRFLFSLLPPSHITYPLSSLLYHLSSITSRYISLTPLPPHPLSVTLILILTLIRYPLYVMSFMSPSAFHSSLYVFCFYYSHLTETLCVDQAIDERVR